MTDELIGIPEKGRNAGVALRDELPPDYDADYILDILNGRGKRAAKTGDNLEEVTRQVEDLDFIRMKDTDRENPRPVFTEMELSDQRVVGYEGEDVFREDFDTVYSAYDEILESAISEASQPTGIESTLYNRDTGFREAAVEQAENQNYRKVDELGDEVKWGVLYPEEQSGRASDIWMVPREFSNLGAVLSRDDVLTMTYEEVAERKEIDYDEEEELIAETEIPGVYMTVSGNTRDNYNLQRSAMDGWISRLGKFERINNQDRTSNGGEIIR